MLQEISFTSEKNILTKKTFLFTLHSFLFINQAVNNRLLITVTENYESEDCYKQPC